MTILPLPPAGVARVRTCGPCVSQNSHVYLHIDLELLTHDAGFGPDSRCLEPSRGFGLRQSPLASLTREFLKRPRG